MIIIIYIFWPLPDQILVCIFFIGQLLWFENTTIIWWNLNGTVGESQRESKGRKRLYSLLVTPNWRWHWFYCMLYWLVYRLDANDNTIWQNGFQYKIIFLLKWAFDVSRWLCFFRNKCWYYVMNNITTAHIDEKANTFLLLNSYYVML